MDDIIHIQKVSHVQTVMLAETVKLQYFDSGVKQGVIRLLHLLVSRSPASASVCSVTLSVGVRGVVIMLV